MTNKENTVTYHRAEYRPVTDEPWRVWFTKDQDDPYWFTAEQGEAMGLTVPEPAPLVVECRGHRIELSDEEARFFAMGYPANTPHQDHLKRVSGTVKLAGLLRDARQDPQPNGDAQAWLAGERVPPQPTVDTPSDDIDFDALPIGTVLRGKRTDSRYCVVKTNTGEWTWASDDVGGPVWTAPIEWRIVYQPPALSPRQCLEALLAGRDDADELIDYAAATYKLANVSGPGRELLAAIGDAARGGA